MREVICERCKKIVFRKERSDAKYRFCSTKCAIYGAVEASKKVNKSGKNNPAWIGGKRNNGLGYILIYKPNHPYHNDYKKKYVFEHRLVMEKKLGRYLKPKERIHHINHIKTDNRIENLILLDQSTHANLHLLDKFKYYWKGKKHSLETRKKMSNAHKKIWKTRKFLASFQA